MLSVSDGLLKRDPAEKNERLPKRRSAQKRRTVAKHRAGAKTRTAAKRGAAKRHTAAVKRRTAPKAEPRGSRRPTNRVWRSSTVTRWEARTRSPPMTSSSSTGRNPSAAAEDRFH